jgi:hypothetical protein
MNAPHRRLKRRLCHRPPTGGHTGFDVPLVKIVHDDVQCDQEGFESRSMAMSPLGKGSIWLAILAETFRSCLVSRNQYASEDLKLVCYEHIYA